MLQYLITDNNINIFIDYETKTVERNTHLGKKIEDLLIEYQNEKNANDEIKERGGGMVDWEQHVQQQYKEEIKQMLSPGFRIPHESNGQFLYDNDGNFYLADYPEYKIPSVLKKRMVEFLENDYPINALVNFWEKCIQNPNEEARNGLYKFLENSGHPITENGNFIAQKAVLKTKYEKIYKNLIDTISYAVWKISIMKKGKADYHIIKRGKNNYSWHSLAELNNINDHEYIGTVKEVENELKDKIRNNKDIYTDKHSNTFSINLGEPVLEIRSNCDENPKNTCSRGLHVGSMKYVNKFQNPDNDVILNCLINPKDVVCVPYDYDSQKMRVCKYYPISVFKNDENNNIYTEYNL